MLENIIENPVFLTIVRVISILTIIVFYFEYRQKKKKAHEKNKHTIPSARELKEHASNREQMRIQSDEILEQVDFGDILSNEHEYYKACRLAEQNTFAFENRKDEFRQLVTNFYETKLIEALEKNQEFHELVAAIAVTFDAKCFEKIIESLEFDESIFPAQKKYEMLSFLYEVFKLDTESKLAEECTPQELSEEVIGFMYEVGV